MFCIQYLGNMKYNQFNKTPLAPVPATQIYYQPEYR